MIPVHFKRTLDKRLEPLRQRFEALQPRERLLIIMVGMVLVWALAQVFYFNAAAMREKQLYRALSEAHQQIAQLEAREQVLRVQLSERSLAVFESKRAELMRKRVELDEALKKQGVGLMDAEQMRQVLHELLQGSNLSLIALHRLSPELAFSTSDQQAEDQAEAKSVSKAEKSEIQHDVSVYRHPVQIELEGRYADIVSYLERLEDSPWKLMWQELDIKTKNYPIAHMRLIVYTLSLQEDWIGV